MSANCIVIASGNDLSPVCHQSIRQTTAQVLSVALAEKMSLNVNIFIHEITFENGNNDIFVRASLC